MKVIVLILLMIGCASPQQTRQLTLAQPPTTRTLQVWNGGATASPLVTVDLDSGKVTLGQGVTAEDAIRVMAREFAKSAREQGEQCRKDTDAAMHGWEQTLRFLNQCVNTGQREVKRQRILSDHKAHDVP